MRNAHVSMGCVNEVDVNMHKTLNIHFIYTSLSAMPKYFRLHRIFTIVLWILARNGQSRKMQNSMCSIDPVKLHLIYLYPIQFRHVRFYSIVGKPDLLRSDICEYIRCVHHYKLKGYRRVMSCESRHVGSCRHVGSWRVMSGVNGGNFIGSVRL